MLMSGNWYFILRNIIVCLNSKYMHQTDIKSVMTFDCSIGD